MQQTVSSHRSQQLTKMAIAFQENPQSSFEKLGKKIFAVIKNALLKRDSGLYHDLYYDDLIQDIMLKIYLALVDKKFNSEYGEFQTFIYTIVKNAHIDTSRKKKNPLNYAVKGLVYDDGSPLNLVDNLPSDTELTPEALCIKKDIQIHQRRALEKAMSEITPSRRAFLQKKYWEDYTNKEMVSYYEISLSSVKTKLFHARKAVEERIRKNPNLMKTLSLRL